MVQTATEPHSSDPVAVLAEGVAGYAPYIQASGELHDPVYDEPTQYGTAYYAYCCAVLAQHAPTQERAAYLTSAERSLDAALSHTSDPSRPAHASGFDHSRAVSRSNHRDFTWPPILRTFQVLREAEHPRVGAYAERIADVDIEASFESRPPSNWAAVWLSGEWLRIREGLSPYQLDHVDDWLGSFFAERVLVDQGLYLEPGLPNSYDLFTRLHLADLLLEGYHGAWAEPMRRLLVTGTLRSLGVQLSDGSLASAHRSTGQSWTVSAQIAFFTYAAELLTTADDSGASACSAGDLALTVRAANAGTSRALSERARSAAALSYASFRRWRRVEGGPYSPVENVLPAHQRVGYEGYTAQAHYGCLALGFLAHAVRRGFADEPAAEGDRPASVWIEDAPTYRALAHHGRCSVHLIADPAPAYDAVGVTDLAFGPGRFLQLVSSAHPDGATRSEGPLVNVGLIPRRDEGGQLTRLSGWQLGSSSGSGGFTAGADAAQLRLEYTASYAAAQIGRTCEVLVQPDEVVITEQLSGPPRELALVVPYVVDAGTGVRTRTVCADDGVVLQHGNEQVRISIDATIAAVSDEPGWQNRRGRCQLLRIDLAAPATEATYRFTVLS